MQERPMNERSPPLTGQMLPSPTKQPSPLIDAWVACECGAEAPAKSRAALAPRISVDLLDVDPAAGWSVCGLSLPLHTSRNAPRMPPSPPETAGPSRIQSARAVECRGQRGGRLTGCISPMSWWSCVAS